MYDLYVMANKSHMHKIKCCSKGADKDVGLTPTFRVSLFISLSVDFLCIVYTPQTPYIIAVSLLAVGMICLAMSTLICWYVRTSFRQNLIVKQISIMCWAIVGRIYLGITMHLNINLDNVMTWKHFPRCWPFVDLAFWGRSKPVTGHTTVKPLV